MKRTKSINDINEQRSRLFESGRLSGSRMQRVFNTAERYIRNIQSQKAFADKARQSRIEKYSGHYSRSNAIIDDAKNQQYSRRQYMGLSAG